jgi:hypothetical protein
MSPQRFEYHPPVGTPVLKQKRLTGVLCAPTEIRTPVLTLKGLRPGPLDDGGVCFFKRADCIIQLRVGQGERILNTTDMKEERVKLSSCSLCTLQEARRRLRDFSV